MDKYRQGYRRVLKWMRQLSHYTATSKLASNVVLEFLVFIAVQKDTDKLAAGVTKEREHSTKLAGKLAHAVSIFRNTPIHILFFGSFVSPQIHCQLGQLQRQVLEKNRLHHHATKLGSLHLSTLRGPRSTNGKLALRSPRRKYSALLPLISPLFLLIAGRSSLLLAQTAFSAQRLLSVTPNISTTF